MRMDKVAACPFCGVEPERVFLADDAVLAFWDLFPASPGHALIVPRRHVVTWFEATPAEQQALALAVGAVCRAVEQRARDRGDALPDGYNVGFNRETSPPPASSHCCGLSPTWLWTSDLVARAD